MTTTAAERHNVERIATALEALVELHSEMLSLTRIAALDHAAAFRQVEQAVDDLERHLDEDHE